MRADASNDKHHDSGRGFHTQSNIQVGLSIFVLLISVFSLTYSGTFITDDEHILASRTLSLAFDGNINDSRVFGNSRVFALASLSPEYAARGTNIEPGQAVVGALLARLSVLIGAGRVQTIFLLNIWATALTAAILFGLILYQGYSRSAATITALLFGVGTIAWPYTRSYFRDPLAMLFLTIAWACTLVISTRRNVVPGRKLPDKLIWTMLIASMLAGVLTKNTVLIALPVLLLYILVRKYQDGTKTSLKNLFRHHRKNLLYLAAAGMLAVALWIVLLPPDGTLARFTFNYYRSVFHVFFMTPHPGFLGALTGPIISPGKSIFIYSPILLLSFLKPFKRPELTWPAWSYLLLLIISQALFYDDQWWGHINWGLRFVLPAIPALMLASVPVIEDWLTTARGRWGLFAIGSIAVSVQLAGVLAPIHEYYVALSSAGHSSADSAALWDLKYSALAWHLKWILSGGLLDLAATRVGLQAVPVVLGFVIIIGILLSGWARRSDARIPLLALIFSLVLTAFMVLSYRDDPAYFRSRADLKAALEKIQQGLAANDLVILKSYGAPAWEYWMNWSGPDVQWVSLPFYFPAPRLIDEYRSTHDPEVALDEISLSLLKNIPASYRRVWLVVPGDSPGADLGLEIDWLGKRSASRNFWVFPGNGVQTQLYLFELSRD